MISISKMSGKMEGIGSINTDTTSNKFCIKMQRNKKNICSQCYSQRMLTGFRKNCVPSFKRNSDLLSTKLLTEKELPIIKDEIFRFSSHGEVINATMYKNLISIVKHNPNTIFSLYTKRIDLVNKYGKMGAKNIILIYSEPVIDNKESKVPKNFDKIFKAFSKTFVEGSKVKINCMQKCNDCRICYSKNKIEYVHELLKKDQ